jgi:hypothetical protein
MTRAKDERLASKRADWHRAENEIKRLRTICIRAEHERDTAREQRDRLIEAGAQITMMLDPNEEARIEWDITVAAIEEEDTL